MQNLSMNYSPACRAALGALAMVVATFPQCFAQEKTILKGHRSFISTITFAPDGKTFATCEMNSSVKVWDTETLKEIKSFKDGSLGPCVAFSPDGKLLAATGANAPARLYDVTTWEIKHKLGDSKETTGSVAFLPGGNFVLLSSVNDEVQIWETKTAKLVDSFDCGFRFLSTLAISPDGKTLVTSGFGHAILWDWPAKKERAKLEGLKRNVHRIAFSPDGKTLATVELDFEGPVFLWDPATGKKKCKVDQTEAVILPSAVAFSPNSQLMALAGRGYILLWDVLRGRQAAILKAAGDQPAIEAIAFFPNGKQLIAGCTDGTLRIWDVPKIEGPTEKKSD